jgi:hypothetical protein
MIVLITILLIRQFIIFARVDISANFQKNIIMWLCQLVVIETPFKSKTPTLNITYVAPSSLVTSS